MIVLAFIISLLIINGCNASRNSSGESKNSSISISQSHSGVVGDTIIISNDQNHLLLISKAESGNDVWLVSTSTAHAIKITSLGKDDSINSASISPDGKLIVFQTDNIAGHSPLTTSHVWIMQSDGSDLRMITQPDPNQRFSTSDPKWNSDGTLSLKGMTLTSSSGVKYLYDYYKNKIEEKISNE